MSLTHRERLENCLAGNKVDRAPIALWRHFPVDDQTGDGLAAATAAFQKNYDFDLIKVTPASSYSIRGYGVEDRWEGEPEGTRRYLTTAIHTPDDWGRLPDLDPRSGKTGEVLSALRLLTAEYARTTPILQTIFNPLSQAKHLVGKERLLVHLRQYPAEVHAGLRKLTDQTLVFLEAAKSTGIDGIFFAVQHGQYGVLNENEFDEFSRQYDLEILNAVQDLHFNMLHLHGENVMFHKVIDYPVQIINWHDQSTTPSLREAQKLFSGALCGGLRQWETMVLGTPMQVNAEAQAALKETGGHRFILGTGCVTPTTAPYGNLMAARKARRGALWLTPASSRDCPRNSPQRRSWRHHSSNHRPGERISVQHPGS